MSLFNSLIPTLSREPANQTSPRSSEHGVVTIKPRYDIQESADAWGLSVHLPGVNKDGLELTVDQSQLRILGRKAWKAPAGWTTLYQESPAEDFELVIEHDNAIDAEKIHAELKDGILRVALPKAAAIKPRKVGVN